MARIPFTLRMDAEEHSALESLSEIEGRPINQLINDAIKSYLSREGRNERSLDEHLARLRAYRKKDPGFQRAIAEFVEAEASMKDPLEGEIIEGDIDKKPSGPVQSKIREILGA